MNKLPDSASRARLSNSYILLTGGTGLVGRYLLRDLCLAGCRLAVIVRPSKQMSVEDRVEAIQQQWEAELGISLPRPVVFEGDIVEDNLGLDESATRWISQHVEHVIHNAAILTFTGSDRSADPWRTNLGGTKNVIEFCRDNGLRNLSYVSTAYVCGIRDSIVPESDFGSIRNFRNDYEKSKFEAEQAVRDAGHFDSVTIFRPAVIVGDSQTGYTSTYHGLFLYLRLLSTIISAQPPNSDGVIETPIKLPMTGDEPRNLITVDWVSAVISHIVCTPSAHGRTYHLTPDHCTTPRQIIDACYEYFNSSGVEYCGHDKERVGDSDFAMRFFENARVYEAYEKNDPQFDRSNVRQFAGHLPCPAIDEAMIVRFLKFGKSDNWGKGRAGSPEVNFPLDRYLDNIAGSLLQLVRTLGGSDAFLIGLDVHGAGGGQWQIRFEGDSYEIERGLPRNSNSLVQMDIADIAAMSGSAGSSEFGPPMLERYLDLDPALLRK